MQVDLAAPEEPSPGIAPLILRFEGGDAKNHQIDLRLLGESLQGFGRCFAVAANFAVTGTPAQHADALEVRVVATPTPEHNCFEIWALVKPILESKELWSGAAGLTLGPIVGYIFSKRTKDEMKHLADALKQSMGGNQEVTERLLTTVEKLAEALNPSVRKALTPISRSCEEIGLYSGNNKIQNMDAETKKVFAARTSKIADHSKQFVGVISEFDMHTGTCKVLLEGEAERVPAKVLDPVFSIANNVYVESMAAVVPLKFIAKYELDDEGKLARLHIFDTAEE